MLRPGLVVLACLLALQLPVTASEFSDLANEVPAGANTVLVIDVDRALATEMAKANGWGDPDRAADRPMYLPPEADKVIVAAQVDPPNRFHQAWEAAVIGLKESIPMRMIAEAEGGYEDTISDTKAAWIPSNAYVLQLKEKTLGLLHPANRQSVSRWMEARQSARTGASGYLANAIGAAQTDPQIVLALDTADTMPTHLIHQRMTQSDVVAKHKLDIDETVALFATLKGITMEIIISDTATTRAHIDFGQDVPFDGDVAKEFVLAAMRRMEAEIPGVEDWNFSVSGKSIFAIGELDTDGLRRVLSTAEIPSTKFSSLKDEDTKSESTEDQMAQKSYVYFQSINKLIDDLQRQSKSFSGDSYWFDKYAKKIDRLPILHVDPELLDFGQNTAETLRVMSGSRKSANLKTGVARTNIEASGVGTVRGGYYNNGYGRYNNGYRGAGYYRPSPTAEASAKQKSVNAANRRNQSTATSKKIEGFRLINNATAEMRRTLTERYNKEF